MLTKLTVQNFKRFEKAEIPLDQSVVFVGPNNSGKTTALQALALWDLGVKRWLDKRGGTKSTATKRPGVTIGRAELSTLPIPETGLLWRNRSLRRGTVNEEGKKATENILVTIGLEGIDGNETWSCKLEFDFANDESIYCRPVKDEFGGRSDVPASLGKLRVAFLPPMSGLSDREYVKQPGEISDLVGQGRTADVLRNLCHRIVVGPDGAILWDEIVSHVDRLFRVTLFPPTKLANDQLVLRYRDGQAELDISCSGRGLQQTLLLLTHLYGHPGSVWLLDEPDAHLEFIRQGQTYDLIAQVAEQKKCQVLIATHSEKVLASAADRHQIVAFIGNPHSIGGKTSQVSKALKDIPYDEYLQAEQMGWVLYIEGSTDLAILRAFAIRLNHPSMSFLDPVFWKTIGNQQAIAENNYEGIKEALPDLKAYLLLDRQDQPRTPHPSISRHLWSRREIENYLCQPETLNAYAENLASRDAAGPLFEGETIPAYRLAMEQAIEDRVAKKPLSDPNDPFWKNTKVSEEFLPLLLTDFTQRLGIFNEMAKGDYHRLVEFIPDEAIDPEVIQVLDEICSVAQQANRQS